jgi:hypothetical protein
LIRSTVLARPSLTGSERRHEPKYGMLSLGNRMDGRGVLHRPAPSPLPRTQKDQKIMINGTAAPTTRMERGRPRLQ